MDKIEWTARVSFSTGAVTLASQRIDFNSLGKVKALSQITLDAGAGAITEATR